MLNRAFDVAKNIFETSSNPQEAFKKANVSPETLKSIRNYMNNPMASYILKPFGLDINETKSMLDSLEMGLGGYSVPSTPSGNELSSLQASLEKLKK